MIKVSIGDLLVSEGALDRLQEQHLRLREAYDVERRARVVRKEIALFHEKRNELIKALGKEGEDGSISIEQNTDAHKQFQEQIQELVNTEIELPIAPLSLRVLGEKELAAQDVRALFWLFEETPEGEA